MKIILALLLALCLAMPIKAQTSKTKNLIYAATYTGLAVWGWKSTDNHNSGYIRVAASWCTIRALANWIVFVAK